MTNEEVESIDNLSYLEFINVIEEKTIKLEDKLKGLLAREHPLVVLLALGRGLRAATAQQKKLNSDQVSDYLKSCNKAKDRKDD